MSVEPIELTRIINRGLASDLDPEVGRRLFIELRTIARATLRNEAKPSEATTLVSECVLRLCRDERANGLRAWESRRHFFSSAASVMSRILIDRARKRKTVKHGGHYTQVPLLPHTASHEDTAAALEIMEIVELLEEHHEKHAAVFRLVSMCGLTRKEVAEVLDLSPDTVSTYWKFSMAWISRRIIGE